MSRASSTALHSSEKRDGKEKRIKKSKRRAEKKQPVFSGNMTEAKSSEKPLPKPSKPTPLPKYGYTVFQTEGLNFARLLTVLCKECDLKKVDAEGRVLTFSVPSKQCNEIIAILDRLCYDYKIINNTGIIPRVFGALKRAGVAAGLVCVIAALIVYPHFVTEIEVDGTLSEQAAAVLDEYGITEGSFLWKLDGKSVSDKLLAMDGIAFASVEKRGTRVYVTLKSELNKDDFIDITGGAVTARKQGVVTRVIVHGGTAAVKYGDIVNKGDILIADYVEVGDEKVTTPAGGQVFGKVYYERTDYYPDTVMQSEKGRTETYTRLTMFSLSPKTPSSPFGRYELSTSVEDFGFLLPFKIYTWSFTEIFVSEKANTMTDDEMTRLTYSRLATDIEADAKVLKSYSEIGKTEGGTRVKVIIEAEEQLN